MATRVRGWPWRRFFLSVVVGAGCGALAGGFLFADVPLTGAVVGAGVGVSMGVLVVVRSCLVARWGAVSSWAVLALVAGALSGVWLWVVPGCYVDVGVCARGSLSWALVGVLWVALTALLVSVGGAVVRVVRSVWSWRGSRGA